MATIKKAAPAAADFKESWNKITGKARVYVKTFDERTSISLSVGNKKSDGTWQNFYLPVVFAQACDITLVEGLNNIYIHNAFFTAREIGKEEKRLVMYLMITEAEIMK